MSRTDPLSRAWRFLIGTPRDVGDPRLFHHVSLVAFLAWVGLGADGLSSSCYGPEEAFRHLGGHPHLALVLVLMMAATIALISIAYSNVIAHFPSGGGGYLVASKLLGRQAGVVSGCALLVDYVLTITVSVASACDQLWSFLPAAAGPAKLPAEFLLIGLLVLLNLRGVRESVTVLAPIFLVFIVTHAAVILLVVATHLGALPGVVSDAATTVRETGRSLGWWPLILILLRAYALGGGTYTGIEAVSNGVASFREPRVRTGQRTMLLMAVSLAFTAGGILLGYLLTGATPVPGKTLNAVFFERVLGNWAIFGLPIGNALVVLCLAAGAALLVVAAQAGFLDGPRVLANMALDSWMPHRFAQLSDRLVTQNGVVVMGLAAMAALLYTRGSVGALVVMYSINVFITFSLTELGMTRHWIRERRREPLWKRQLAIHGAGLAMCSTILVVIVLEKFAEGGWVTLVATGAVIALSHTVRRHYDGVGRDLARLDDVLISVPPPPPTPTPLPDRPLDREAPTAVICVNGFSGFGIHQVLSIHRSFPNHFRNFLFVSASVIDSGAFKGEGEVENLRRETERTLQRYVAWAESHGLSAGYRTALGTEAVATTEEICRQVSAEFPRAVVFLGKLIFERERWYQRLLHNESALAIERRLHFDGVQAMVLPIRVLES